MEPKEVTGAARVARFFSEDWPEKLGAKHALMRYYLVPFEPTGDFAMPGFTGDTVSFCSSEFKVIVAHIAERHYFSHVPWVVKADQGNHQIFVEKLPRELPSGVYVVITTPMRADIAPEDAVKFASIATDSFVGMMRAFGGNNLFRQMVYEPNVELSGELPENTMSDIIPAIHGFDGPFATDEVWSEFNEIDAALDKCSEVMRDRVMRATELMEQAAGAQMNLKMFSYWVAFEVAAGAGFHKAMTLLANAYHEGKGKAYVQNTLGVEALFDVRNAMFHQGKSYEMPPVVERYFQQLLLDVFRAVLGLPCQRYMEREIKKGFEVRWISEGWGTVKTFPMPENDS